MKVTQFKIEPCEDNQSFMEYSLHFEIVNHTNYEVTQISYTYQLYYPESIAIDGGQDYSYEVSLKPGESHVIETTGRITSKSAAAWPDVEAACSELRRGVHVKCDLDFLTTLNIDLGTYAAPTVDKTVAELKSIDSKHIKSPVSIFIYQDNSDDSSEDYLRASCELSAISGSPIDQALLNAILLNPKGSEIDKTFDSCLISSAPSFLSAHIYAKATKFKNAKVQLSLDLPLKLAHEHVDAISSDYEIKSNSSSSKNKKSVKKVSNKNLMSVDEFLAEASLMPEGKTFSMVFVNPSHVDEDGGVAIRCLFTYARTKSHILFHVVGLTGDSDDYPHQHFGIISLESPLKVWRFEEKSSESFYSQAAYASINSDDISQVDELEEDADEDAIPYSANLYKVLNKIQKKNDEFYYTSDTDEADYMLDAKHLKLIKKDSWVEEEFNPSVYSVAEHILVSGKGWVIR